MTRLSLFLVLLASTAFAAPVPKELKREVKFEGTWKLISCDCAGAVTRFNKDQHWTLDNEMNLSAHVGPTPPKIDLPGLQIRFDVNSEPKRADFKYADQRPGAKGLYEISRDGDTLKLCMNMNSGERPKAIAPGENIYLWTLQRVKTEGGK